MILVSLDFYIAALDCGHPTPPLNGYIVPYSSTIEGSRIHFKCDLGFTLEGGVSADCQSNGKWSYNSTQTTCNPVSEGKHCIHKYLTITVSIIIFAGKTNDAHILYIVIPLAFIFSLLLCLLLGAFIGLFSSKSKQLQLLKKALPEQYTVSENTTNPIYEEIAPKETTSVEIEFDNNVSYGNNINMQACSKN